MDISKIHIIGTSHIAEESVREIEKFVEQNNLNLVCVELDRERLYALKHNLEERIKITNIGMLKKIGLTGFLFALIAHSVQKKMGEKVDTKAGSDMLSAVDAASSREIPVALIDQSVNITLRNLSKKVPFSEKFRVVKDLILGLLGFKSALVEVNMKDVDLRKVPPEQMITKVLSKAKSRYPNLYAVLVEERNEFMVNKVEKIASKHPDWNILVVVGAGHKDGMIEFFEKKTGMEYVEKSKFKAHDDENGLYSNSGSLYSYSHSVKYK